MFQRFDTLAPSPSELDDAHNKDLYEAIRAGDSVGVGKALHNDLQVAALDMAPDLQLTIDLVRECGALGVLVSGSGPTVAALARDAQHATSIAEELIAEGVCANAFTTVGPVRGAHTV